MMYAAEQRKLQRLPDTTENDRNNEDMNLEFCDPSLFRKL